MGNMVKNVYVIITISYVLTKPWGIFENWITTRKRRRTFVALGDPFLVQNSGKTTRRCNRNRGRKKATADVDGSRVDPKKTLTEIIYKPLLFIASELTSWG